MLVTILLSLPLLLPTIAQVTEPLRAGSDVDPPRRVKTVDPEYPETARVNWIQGVVVLDAVVDERGRVANIETIRSISLLDQAAIEAVRQWEFEPTSVDGQPRSVVMTIPVSFTLPRADEWRVVPEGDAELEIERYDLVVGEDGSWTYSGRVRNISNEVLSGLRARVSYTEGFPRADEEPSTGSPPGIDPPEKTKHILPRYPREARRSGIQGVVIVEFFVDVSGEVENVRVLRSIPSLDPAVLEAVQGWEYEPARRDGVPIPALVMAQFGFWDDEVELTERVPLEFIGVDHGVETVDLGALDPGTVRDFAVDVRTSLERELRGGVLNFFLQVEDEMRAVPTRRQRRTLPSR